MCDYDYLVETSTTIYMVGNAVGAVTLTSLSDRFGRKYVMLLMLWIQGIIGFGAAFANSYILFTILRFFIALLNMVSYIQLNFNDWSHFHIHFWTKNCLNLNMADLNSEQIL